MPLPSVATLDQLLTQAAQRRPDEVALSDPPNRASFTDGMPRRLTYAQADRMVSAIAGRLLVAPDDGHELVQRAAALLSGLVAEGALSEETADLLWLDIAACAAVQRFTSRPAAEASIP